MDVLSDTPTTLLIFFNVLQVAIILALLLPIIDIVTLSKNVKDFTDSARNNPITAILLFSYGFIVVIYGILSPAKTLTELQNSKLVREEETPEDILRRIVTCSNASRNYILGAFSLFFLLVIIRLFDYVKFSAKLHEFSELMANYDLIDIALINEPAYDSNITFVIDEPIEEEEDETVPWPITTDFNKEERSQIRTFLRDTPRKLSVLAGRAKGVYEKTRKHVSKKPAVTERKCDKTIDIINTESEIFEIIPKNSEKENTAEKEDTKKKQ